MIQHHQAYDKKRILSARLTLGSETEHDPKNPSFDINAGVCQPRIMYKLHYFLALRSCPLYTFYKGMEIESPKLF